MATLVNQMQAQITAMDTQITQLKKRKYAQVEHKSDEEDRDSNVIGFITKEGGYVELMIATPGGDREAKCFIKMQELHEENVKVTFEKMRRFGFGTVTIRNAMDSYKEWVASL
jgi:hypothetical protein